MATDQTTKKRHSYDWFRPFMERFFSDMESFHESLHYSTIGVAKLRGSSRLAKALVPFLPEDKPDLEQAERETQWAEEETSAGFPTLHAYAAVTLYALLESIVRELLASWLLENENATEARTFF